MKIYIPNSAFIYNIDSFLDKFDPSNGDLLEITTNDKWISMHPVVLCMLAALGDRVKKVTIDEITAKSGHYITRMGLYSYLRLPSPHDIEEHESAGRFIPITRIENNEQLTHLLNDLVPLLHLPAEQAQSIRYIMSELVRNVLEHALTDMGAIVAAQYHQKSNMIRVGIVDTGVGIKQSMASTHHPSTDIAGIKMALIPGLTGTTLREGGTDYNAGAGLFFIKSIASINKGLMMIYSGTAMYKLLKSTAVRKRLFANPDRDKHSERDNLPHWQGTVIGIDIPLETNEAFTNLMRLIQGTYTEAVRERKKERFRRARFI